MLEVFAKAGRDFTLMNITDPQLPHVDWENDHINGRILKRTLDTVINKIKPDLITVSGDISYGGDILGYKYFADYMDTFGIPWAVAFGNHDNQGGAQAICEAVEEFKKHSVFLYEPCDPELGNGNYVIVAKQDGVPVQGIIMMDSHDRLPYKTESGDDTVVWAKLMPCQLDWYREKVAELEALGCRDTTIVTHIPIYAFREAFSAALRDGVDPNTVKPENSTGSAIWNEGYEDSFGVLYEGICSHPEDDGMFDLIRELGSTKNYICGHDHVNNFVINHKGLRFIYGMKAGAGCYWNPAVNGATVVTYSKDGTSKVYHEYVDVSDML